VAPSVRVAAAPSTVPRTGYGADRGFFLFILSIG
jgi:hypothetical protein